MNRSCIERKPLHFIEDSVAAQTFHLKNICSVFSSTLTLNESLHINKPFTLAFLQDRHSTFLSLIVLPVPEVALLYLSMSSSTSWSGTIGS